MTAKWPSLLSCSNDTQGSLATTHMEWSSLCASPLLQQSHIVSAIMWVTSVAVTSRFVSRRPNWYVLPFGCHVIFGSIRHHEHWYYTRIIAFHAYNLTLLKITIYLVEKLFKNEMKLVQRYCSVSNKYGKSDCWKNTAKKVSAFTYKRKSQRLSK